MVHALEGIHRLLRPSGTLIEIHPVHGAWVEVRSGDDVVFVEPDPGFDSDAELRPTDEALRTVVRRGVFALGRSQEFDFLTYASSVRELRDHFTIVGGYSEGPPQRTTHLRDALYARAHDVMTRSAEARLAYREQAKMSRFVPEN